MNTEQTSKKYFYVIEDMIVIFGAPNLGAQIQER